MPNKIDMSKRLIASFLEEKDASKTENKKIENIDFSTLNDKEFINLYNNYKKSLSDLKSLEDLILYEEYNKQNIINKINNRFRPIINIVKEQNYENIYIPIKNYSYNPIYFHITKTRILVSESFNFPDEYEIEMDKIFWMNIYNNIDDYINEFIEKLSSLFKDKMDKCYNKINIISNYLENIKEN